MNCALMSCHLQCTFTDSMSSLNFLSLSIVNISKGFGTVHTGRTSALKQDMGEQDRVVIALQSE